MEKKGIVGCLMDLSFQDFVTIRIIPILYIVAIVVAALVSLGIIVSGLSSGHGAAGATALIVGPIMFVFNVLMARIWLELVIAIFRVADNTRRMAESAGVAPPPPEPQV